MKYTIYYDSDVDGRLYPLWYIVEGEMDWSQPSVFFSINQPFNRVNSIDLDDGALGCAVHAGEMIINQYKPDQFGVSIEALRSRIELSIEPEQIRRLIFQISDIEDILSVGKERFAWS